MKKLALFTSVVLATSGTMSASEVENLRSANAEHKRQINALEKEIENLYSLLEKEMRSKGKTPTQRGTKQPVASHSIAKGGVYVVKGGDTLSRISRNHKVSLSALMAANKLNSQSVLQIGQKLVIPGGSVKFVSNSQKPIEEARRLAPLPALPTSPQNGGSVARSTSPKQTQHSKGGFYLVKGGDTFYAIARKNKVSVTSLTKANPGINPSRLQVGQKIQLPAMAVSGSSNEKIPAAIPVFTNKQHTKQTQPKIAKTNQGTPQASNKALSQAKAQPKNFNTITTRNEKADSQPAPRPVENKPRVEEEENEVMTAVVLPAPITMRKLAEQYGTTVEAINALNSWAYRANQTLAKGSEVFLQTR